jgi:hypothetical protein
MIYQQNLPVGISSKEVIFLCQTSSIRCEMSPRRGASEYENPLRFQGVFIIAVTLLPGAELGT